MKKVICSICILFLAVISAIGQNPEPLNERSEPIEQDILTPEKAEDFNERSRIKVEEFQKHLSTIANKKRPLQERLISIKEAEKLFIPEAVIEISTLNKDKPKRIMSISRYLQAIFNAQGYTQVKITFYDSCKMGKWEKKTSGVYESMATIYQQFEGYMHGKLKYADKTTKKVQVNLEESKSAGFDISEVKVMLGNVSVSETKPVTSN